MKEDKKRLKDEKRLAKARIRTERAAMAKAKRERSGSQAGLLRQLIGMSTKSDRSKMECQHLFRQFLDAQTCFPELNGGHVPERRVKSNGVVPMHVVVEL